MKDEKQLIEFRNNGQEILQTNYWKTEHAKKGLVYLSWNAGAARLLVPKKIKSMLKEIKDSKYVIISRGNWAEYDRDGIEILFEDNSDSPYCLHITTDQTDRLLPETDQGGGFVVAIWTEEGKKYQFKGKYREVDVIPFAQPWENH